MADNQGFINVFRRKAIGFHRWGGGCFELNFIFFLQDGQTSWATLSLQLVKQPGAQSLMKNLHTYAAHLLILEVFFLSSPVAQSSNAIQWLTYS